MIKAATLYIVTGVLTFLVGVGIVGGFGLFSTARRTDLGAANVVVQKVVPEETRYHDFYSPQHSPTIPSHELENETVPAGCDHRILEPLWEVLIKQKEFRDDIAIGNGPTWCGDMFEIALIDLNGDGQKEILLRGKPPAFCGAVGNCAFWIFQKSGSKYRIILETSDYIDRSEMGEQLLRTKTRGYSDLLLKGHFSAADTRFSYYKFNGRRYVASRCLFEVPNHATEDDNDWHFVTCKQFYKFLNL